MSALTITKTDTLEVEFMPLSIMDLSLPFMFRITKPFVGPWMQEKVRVIDLIADPRQSIELKQVAARKALEWWNDNNRALNGEEVPEEAKWLFEINKAEAFEVTTVRKADCQDDACAK